MSNPRVSVVIPTYNRADLVLEAIESVLRQTFDSLEVIVVDDGSDDHTQNVIAKDDRVRSLVLKHSGNPARARNAGVAASVGEFVAFLDSDDLWLPRKLERQVEELDHRPEVGLVCTNAGLIDEAGNDLGSRYLRVDQGASGAVLEQLLAENFVIASTAVVRRRLIARTRGFAEEPLLRAVEDYDLWLRLAAISEVVYLAEPLALYRDHASSIRRAVPRSTYWRGLIHLTQRAAVFADAENCPFPREFARRRVGAYRIALAQALQSEHGLARALLAWGGAAGRHPRSVANILFEQTRGDRR